MKTGVFLCTCGRTSSIDYRSVKKSVDADIVEVLDYLCQNEGLSYIIDDIRRCDLDRVLIGCTFKDQVFLDLVGDSVDVSFLNLREHCGWVHDRKAATEKAKRMLSAALALEMVVPERMRISVGSGILVTGDRFGRRVAYEMRGIADVELLLEKNDRKLDDIPVYMGRVVNVSGSIGDFCMEILNNQPIDEKLCTACGKCISACPEGAITYDLAIESACDMCGECVDACPLDAIDLHREEFATLKCGQIVATDPDWEHSRRFGIHVSKSHEYSDALAAALSAIPDIGTIEKEKMIEIREGCAAGKSQIAGCMLCESICPHDAITRNGEHVTFDVAACMGCGACASICPLSIPQLQTCPDSMIYSSMEHLLHGENKLSPLILIFVCPDVGAMDMLGRAHAQYPPVLPLFVPSINAVNEAHILRAFDLGADGVILLGCEQCESETAAKFANTVLSAYNLGERVMTIRGDGYSTESLAHEITDFAERLAPNPKKGKPAEIKSDVKRYVLIDLIKNLSEDIPAFAEKDNFPFANIIVGDECTLCSACVNMCPTLALTKEDGKLTFAYPRCIACGLCEKACPEDAIKIEQVFDLEKLTGEPFTVFESELVRCARCGTPFASKAVIERIGGTLSNGLQDLLNYCEYCKPIKAFEKGLVR